MFLLVSKRRNQVSLFSLNKCFCSALWAPLCLDGTLIAAVKAHIYLMDYLHVLSFRLHIIKVTKYSGSLGLSNCYDQSLAIYHQTGSSLEYNRWQEWPRTLVATISGCNKFVLALKCQIISNKLRRLCLLHSYCPERLHLGLTQSDISIHLLIGFFMDE